MHISDIKNVVVSHFIRNSVLKLEDFDKIDVGDVLKEHKSDLIRQALNDLVEAKFVRSLIADKNNENVSPKPTAWILESPIGSQGQDVPISLGVSELIYSHIKKFKEANKMDNDTNILSITEDDIQFLCVIISVMLNNQVNEEEVE